MAKKHAEQQREETLERVKHSLFRLAAIADNLARELDLNGKALAPEEEEVLRMAIAPEIKQLQIEQTALWMAGAHPEIVKEKQYEIDQLMESY